MSVHRSRRTVAYSEFERQMGKIHQDVMQRAGALPARYKKYLMPPLRNAINRAYDSAIMANEQRGKLANATPKKQQCLHQAAIALQALQCPLLALMNLRGITEDGCKAIAESINREFALIWGAAGWDKEANPMPMIYPLPREKMKTLAFLGVMGRLHKFTYEKIGHAPQDCFDSLTVRIKDYIDQALCDVCLANAKMPTNRAEADSRDALLKDAIDCLNGLQRPLFGLWNIQDYSENIMDEWAGMIDEEIKILVGLRQKDRERYKDLK